MAAPAIWPVVNRAPHHDSGNTDPAVEGDPVDYVLKRNLDRRQLKDPQLAVIAARLVTAKIGTTNTGNRVLQLSQPPNERSPHQNGRTRKTDFGKIRDRCRCCRESEDHAGCRYEACRVTPAATTTHPLQSDQPIRVKKGNPSSRSRS